MDSRLLQALRSKLGILVEKLTYSDIAKLTEVNVSGLEIVDLTGLEAAFNLTSLDLSDNKISSLEPISNLGNLVTLNIVSNSINTAEGTPQRFIVDAFVSSSVEVYFDDWTSIAVDVPDANLLREIRNNLREHSGAVTYGDMAKLILLGASNSNIVNLTGLEGGVNLTHLYLNGNAIVDLSPLSDLSHLETLVIYLNDIVDLSPLSDSSLYNLRRLFLNANAIVDLSPLSNLLSLEELYLGGNSISNLEPLSNMKFLEYLGLKHNDLVLFAGSPQRHIVDEFIAMGAVVSFHVSTQGLSFEKWLLFHYSETEIAGMGDDSRSIDMDMDGLSNEDEWKLGLDPIDSSSRLAVSITANRKGIHVDVSPVAEGAVFGLRSSLDLNVWEVADPSEQALSGDRYRFTMELEASAFYKVVLE